jgi:tRNA(adenine34) deaminase
MSEVRIFLAAPLPGFNLLRRLRQLARGIRAWGMAVPMLDDDPMMGAALAEARRALELGEVPIGCVLVRNGTIVGRGYNLRESAQDPTAHAEMIALRGAAARLGTWRLSGVTAYVTLEPCPMCAGALVNARVDRVVYGCPDPKAGALNTLYELGSDARLNHRYQVTAGVCAEACASLLSDFFGEIRRLKRTTATRGLTRTRR